MSANRHFCNTAVDVPEKLLALFQLYVGRYVVCCHDVLHSGSAVIGGMLSSDFASSFIWLGNAPISVTLGGILMKVWKLLSAHSSFVVWLA